MIDYAKYKLQSFTYDDKVAFVSMSIDKVYNGLGRYEPKENSNFKKYIKKIIRNAKIDYLKKNIETKTSHFGLSQGQIRDWPFLIDSLSDKKTHENIQYRQVKLCLCTRNLNELKQDLEILERLLSHYEEHKTEIIERFNNKLLTRKDFYKPDIFPSGIIPRDHYIGVSSPCATIVDARNEAFYDVAKQIVRTIGGRYDIRFESRMTQDGDKFRRYADERFRFAGEGFISEIENNIVSSRYTVADGGYVYEMLVHFPRLLLERMIRLSKGAKVLAKKIDAGVYEVREVNGVSCLLTEAEVAVSERNSHAGFLNYYVMKVSDGSMRRFTMALPEPVILRGRGAERIKLMVPNQKNVLADAFLGTKRSMKITLIGTDEVGRIIKVKVNE